MKTKIYLLSTLAMVLLMFLNGFKKLPDFARHLEEKLTEYENKAPDERLYLHLDKPIYKPGDMIWFSAYLVSGPDNKLSPQNKIVYVELIDPKGSVKKKFNVGAISGKGYGNILIGPQMPGGLYKLRAFTTWIRSQGEEYIFSKDIPVQKYVTPNLLLKLDFEKEAYGPGELVRAYFSARNLEDAPLILQKGEYQIQLGGQHFLKENFTTNQEGEAEILFRMPDTITKNDGLLNVLIGYQNKKESVSRSIPIVLNNISLQFFPEGGNLVEGVETRLAFKALNEFGKPADIKGKIYDEKEQIVTGFKSFHDGMGAFLFTPENGRTYTAMITHPEGISRKYSLPQVQPSGYVMNILNLPDNMLEIILHAPHSGGITLVSQVGQKIYYSEAHPLSAGTNKIQVSTTVMPRGINRITLFSPDHKPVCERLVYINDHKKMHIRISTKKSKYSPRDRIDMDIETLDENKKPVQANISLAVINDKVISLADDKQDNILSAFLLSSGIKGKIHEPSFYFDPEEDKALEAIDYLLMTQGWRRYGWVEVLNQNIPARYVPDKMDVISGQVINISANQGVKASLQVVQQGNTKKAMEFDTDQKGRFFIIGADPTSSVIIYANARGVKKGFLRIKIDKGSQPEYNWLSDPNLNTSRIIPEVIRPEVNQTVRSGKDDETKNSNRDMTSSFSLTEDLQNLDEVVVVGYGTQKKSNVTGAISEVETDYLVSANAVENMLQGLASGVVVLNNSGNPGNPSDIKIRGLSGIPNTTPLFIIDGIPYYPVNSGTIPALAHVDQEDIEHIEILKGPVSDYLSHDATNGVVLITTKTEKPDNQLFFHRGYDVSHYIYPRITMSWGRQFYSPNYNHTSQPNSRHDFRETLYWNPNIQTDHKGKTRVTFYMSDEITTFRTIAEGISDRGLIGHNESTIFSQKSVSLDMKVPAYISVSDTLKLNLRIKNNTSRNIKGTLSVRKSSKLLLLKKTDTLLNIGPGQSRVYELPVTATTESRYESLQVAFKSGIYKDKISKQFEVFRSGFPVEASLAGEELDKTFQFNLQNPLKGSLKAEFKAYPNLINNLLDGIESIIRKPYGCFEQTSSSTYPNIMILQYLNKTGQKDPAVRRKAINYISQGYNRLIRFEVKGGGFDWFGRPPANLGLSAYGLMEFVEMEKVYDHVDDQLIERTKNWILSKRNNQGDFSIKHQSNSYSGGSQETLNAYVIYALSEAGISYGEVEKEYIKAISEAELTDDAYRIALMANAAFNLNLPDDGKQLIIRLNKIMKNSLPGSLQVNSTITYSRGKSAQVETASLILMAMLKSETADMAKAKILGRYLAESRSYGGFGSTQATVLALKALLCLSDAEENQGIEGNIELSVNNQPLLDQPYTKGKSRLIQLKDLEEFLIEGVNMIYVKMNSDKGRIPYSLDIGWKTDTPPSDQACKVNIKTALINNQIKQAETARLKIQLSNKTNEDLPMIVALIGLPGGLSPQIWQLKKLQEENVFDYYELRKNYLVLYYTTLPQNDIKTINLDLKGEVPGYYKAPASCAYLYYHEEHKTWIGGEEISIAE